MLPISALNKKIHSGVKLHLKIKKVSVIESLTGSELIKDS